MGYFNKDYTTRHCLTFNFECQDKLKNGLFRCRVHLDKFPDIISKVNLGIGIYADKLYNSSLHSLFKTTDLRKYHSLNLKLQIQLFYLHNSKNQLIKFQPV